MTKKELEKDRDQWKRHYEACYDQSKYYVEQLHKLEELIYLAQDLVTANMWESKDIPKHIKARRDKYIKKWNELNE